MRIFRPRFALLENVKGLKTHPHYPILMQIIQWCGYEVRHECIMDLAQVTPVSRTRLLMVLQRIEDSRAPFTWHSWTPRNEANLLNWDVIQTTPKEEMHQWTPTHEVLLKYWEPKYLPTMEAGATIRDKRIPSHSNKLPVLMATYGAQHEIKEALLQQKGLQGVFMMEHEMCRWFKPTELAIAHQQMHGQILLKPARKSWHAIGNMIATPHAMLILSNWAIHLYDEWDEPRMKMVFQQSFNCKLSQSNMTVVEDDLAWYMGQPHEIVRLQDTLNQFLSSLEGDDNQMQWKEYHFLTQTGLWQEFPASQPADQLESPKRQPTVPATEIDDSQDEQNDNKKRKITPQDTDSEFCCIRLQLPNVSDVAFLAHTEVSWHDTMDHWTIEMKILDVHTRHRISPDQPLQPAFMEYCQGPQDLSTQPTHTPAPVLFQPHESQIKVLPLKGTIADVRNQHPELSGDLQDVYGPLPMDKEMKDSIFLIQDNQVDHIHDIEHLLPSLQAAVCETCVPCTSDTLVVGFAGLNHHLLNVVKFWTLALPQQWLNQFSRTAHLEMVDQKYVKLHFKPVQGHFPCPVELFKDAIMVRLMQVALASFARPTGIRVRFKVNRRNFAQIIMDPAQDIFPLMIITRHAMAVFSHGMQPTFVSAGKRWADQHKVRDMATAQITLDPQDFACTIVPPLLGGANHTQDEMMKQIHSGFAKLFLDHGFEFSKVPTLVSNMIQQIGTTRTMHVIFSDTNKPEKFRELCQLCSISIPSTKQTKEREAKHSKLDHKKATKPVQSIDVTQYKLSEGFFFLQDGNTAPIQETFTPSKMGIAMISANQAEPWLSSPPVLADELAVFVVGDLPEHFTKDLEHRVVPALNAQGQTVLIGGHLKQLGEKHVIMQKRKDDQIPVQKTTICSFTVWADEFSPPQWQEIASAPVRSVRQILKREGNDSMGIPWGRTYKDGKSSTSPQEAKSIQFHAELPTDDLTEILKTSGYNKVYITPKSSTGKPAPEWRVIWHDQPSEVLQAQAMQLPGVCGLIRGLKNRGIRVRADAFDEAWKHLRPNMPALSDLHKGICTKSSHFHLERVRKAYVPGQNIRNGNAIRSRCLGPRHGWW
eukprot:Skav215853  [mRNA]  locus=scaffold1630:245530:248820:- [translate_table: standard]